MKKYIFFIFFTILFSCSNKIESDFKILCSDFASLDGKNKEAQLEIINKLDTKLKTPEGKKAFSAIAIASKRARYDVFLKLAQDAGVKNFTCPEAQKFFTTND